MLCNLPNESPNFYIENAKFDDEIVMYSSALSHAQEHFEELLLQIYDHKTFDHDIFLNSLDEVAFCLNMKLPGADLRIERQRDITVVKDRY
jgi:hypothetical protein